MTRALALPSLHTFCIALAGFAFSLALFFGVAVQRAQAATLTDAQVHALVGVVLAFGGDEHAATITAAALRGQTVAQTPVQEPLAAAQKAALDPNAIVSPPTCVLTASASDAAPSQLVRLSWTSKNATYASMPDGGSGPTSGSITETPSQTTTYQKTVYGPGGTGTCQATVTVLGTTPAATTTQALAAPVDLVAASVQGLDLIDTTFAPDNLVAAAATVVGQDYDLMVEGFTDDFLWLGVH